MGDQSCFSGSLLSPDRDMGARHRARPSSIQIMKVAVVAASKCKRPHITQLHVSQEACVCVRFCMCGILGGGGDRDL